MPRPILFYCPNNIWWGVQIIKLTMQAPALSCYLVPHRSWTPIGFEK
jgi:hypothetical protein